MGNPLKKRLLRELRSELGKYIVIFILLTGTIGFVSGFLVADNSMITAYQDSFEKYTVENGNFELAAEVSAQQREAIEEQGVTFYENYYIEEDGPNESTLRIFAHRTQVNRECVMEGALPEAADEIAIDRMYAVNNDLSVGDVIQAGNEKKKVTGLIALPDYSALFSDNNDMMFDAVKFGVAVVTEEAFAEYGEAHLHYSYSWLYKEEPEDNIEEKEVSTELMKTIGQTAGLTKFIPRYLNQAIQFTGEDMGGDKAMMITLLYILMIIISFVFGVTINNTIHQEAGVIGTLRASGYTKGELLRHYMTLPLIVTVISALIGNLLGYTIFKNVCADMYYGSYSLTTYETIWNAEAFLETTVAPFILMLIINSIVLWTSLSLSPIQFLRHEFQKRQKKKTMRLPRFSFFSRFRLRIIFQNMSNYVILFIGVVFANLLLIFGMALPDILHHFQDEVENGMISTYQYVLKVPVETDNDTAERYGAYSLETLGKNYDPESIQVFGILEESAYVPLDFEKEGIYVSVGYAEKFGVHTGDTIALKEKYSDQEYEFTVAGTYEYPAALAVFMNLDDFTDCFDYEEGYFNGYFSDTEIEDIEDAYISATITEEDLTKLSRQLDVSMGSMMELVEGFALVLFMALIYLLSKIVIEKNAVSISMTKILGYTNSEIRRLYITSTTIAVVVCMLLSLPLEYYMLKLCFYYIMMQEMSGWITFVINPVIYVRMIVYGVVCYFVIAAFLYRKIKKIPMSEALKRQE